MILERTARFVVIFPGYDPATGPVKASDREIRCPRLLARVEGHLTMRDGWRGRPDPPKTIGPDSLERTITVRLIYPRSSGWLGLAFGLALVTATIAPGQEPEPDSDSLARYVPKDDVVTYLEMDGVDQHPEAWQRTATSKILNLTPAGGMIEDVFTQLFEKEKLRGGGKSFALLKHMSRAGFVFAVGGHMTTDQPFYQVVVIRKAFSDRDAKMTIAPVLASLSGGETRPKAVVRVGHTIISGKTPGGQTYSWWVEETKKEDVVIVFPTLEAADLILETLDGKHENAVKHPLLAGLNKPDNGFEPVAFGFVNPKSKGFQIDKSPGLFEATRIDFRWGFEDDALKTILRIATPSPRKGYLAAVDGPTFGKGSMPPMPESLTGFTVVSLDTKAVFDQVMAIAAAASPAAVARINAALDKVQGQGKLRLRDDFLGHLGPKMAFYTLPTRETETASAAPPALALP